jgi:hypothetical protein
MAINSRIEVDKLKQSHIDTIFECYGMTGLPIWEEGSNIDSEQIKRGFVNEGYFISIPEPMQAETNYLIFSPAIDHSDGISYIHLGLAINDYKGDKEHLQRIFNKEIKRHLLH